MIAASDAAAITAADTALRYQHTMLTESFETRKGALAAGYYQDSAHLLGRRFDSVEDRVAYGCLICGSPATVVTQVHTLLTRHSVGVLGLQTHFGNLPTGHVHDSISLFGSHVGDVILDWDAGLYPDA